jgi:hypothetical protein
MKLACSLLLAAMASITAQRAHGQAESSPAERDRDWYECPAWDKADKTCNVPRKEPEYRDHPDAPIALSFGYGMRFAPEPDPRLSGVLPPWQWILALSIDVDRSSVTAIGIEGQYVLEGQGTRELYGGRVSAAFTVHQFAVGPVMRIVWSKEEEPDWALLLRIAPGFASGRLAWRDTVTGRDSTRHDAILLLVTGIGLSCRPTGLTLEGGVIGPFSPLELGQSGSVETLKHSIGGAYLRLSLSIRIP